MKFLFGENLFGSFMNRSQIIFFQYAYSPLVSDFVLLVGFLFLVYIFNSFRLFSFLGLGKIKRNHFGFLSFLEDSDIVLFLLFFHGGMFLFVGGVYGGEQILDLDQRICTLERT